MTKSKFQTQKGIRAFINKHRVYILILLLLLLNIGQFAYFYNQNKQLENRLSQIDKNWKKELSNTKEVVTGLSQYFEGKGNLTIAALLETVDRLKENEIVIQGTIDTLNNNVKIANDKANAQNTIIFSLLDSVKNLQTQITILSGYYGR